MNFILKYVVLFVYLSLNFENVFVNCGIVTINYSPKSLRFGHADPLYASELDDMLAASLGFTPQKLSWPGLTITSAFHYPQSIVAFEVKGGGANVKLEGSSFEIYEDVSLPDVYRSLLSLVSARAQQQVNFKNEQASDISKILPEPISLPESKVLSEKYAEDLSFLQQMTVLRNFGEYVKNVSFVPAEGKDVIFVEVDSFLPLVKKYGKSSPQVKEASQILRASLAQAVEQLKKFFNNRILIATMILNEEKILSRRTREATVGKDIESNVTKSLNLAPVYRDDFPVVFNIILILTIILVVTILAVSVAMAFMDPGRDSIIYRMTNPRMKKDQ